MRTNSCGERRRGCLTREGVAESGHNNVHAPSLPLPTPPHHPPAAPAPSLHPLTLPHLSLRPQQSVLLALALKRLAGTTRVQKNCLVLGEESEGGRGGGMWVGGWEGGRSGCPSSLVQAGPANRHRPL